MLFMKASHSPTMPSKHVAASTVKQGSQSSVKQGSPGSPTSSRPTLSNLFRKSSGNSPSSAPRRKRVGLEDEVLKRNRRAIDNYLRRVGALIGKEISLNSEGMSYFSFGKFVVVIEVPADGSGNFYIYTMVCRLGSSDNLMLVMQTAMKLNYMGFGTRGSTLGLEGEEVNLCYSGPIAGLSVVKLKSTLEAFLRTAFEVNQKLDAAKNITGPLI
jgi:hypothetical protein